jgi:hypothetical protein
LLAVAIILGLAAIGSVSAQAAPAIDVAAQSFAQADKPSTMTRVKTWTRAKLDAAKKRWAADKAKFEDCQKQLVEERKAKKLSIHKQGHFLQACMNKKP